LLREGSGLFSTNRPRGEKKKEKWPKSDPQKKKGGETLAFTSAFKVVVKKRREFVRGMRSIFFRVATSFLMPS